MSDMQSSPKQIAVGLLLAAAILVLLFAAVPSARAQTLTTLYGFTGSPDGAYPSAGVIMDPQGNLYGTTSAGGGSVCEPFGCGTVFMVTPGGTETVLSNKFSRGSGSPSSGLIWDARGNLYGTTGCYRRYHRNRGYYSSFGAVFELKKKLKNRTKLEYIYHFSPFEPIDNGYCPGGGLVMDGQGTFYGTTVQGGVASVGTVFELMPVVGDTVLHSFAGWTDGEYPETGLTQDTQGDLYGTTSLGGGPGCGGRGCGTVFMVTPGGSETVLYSFTGGIDGLLPEGGLVFDPQGNLYGTTSGGGGSACHAGGPYPGCGTVFELTAAGTEIVLYRFCLQDPNCTDGESPVGNLLLDAQGNLYGTTVSGGAYGGGTVFKLTSAGTDYTVLYSFCPSAGCQDGNAPYAGLIMDAEGNLYGTTYLGGAYGYGTVFKLTP